MFFAYTDTEMQTEIDTYISRGQASFNVQLLVSFKVRAWITHYLEFNPIMDLTTFISLFFFISKDGFIRELGTRNGYFEEI